MATLLHQLLTESATRTPAATAIVHKHATVGYRQLAELVHRQAQALVGCQLARQQRVAVFLPKQVETVSSLLAAAAAGGVFVPINPVLKAEQVRHILNDCAVRVLFTSTSRWQGLRAVLAHCPDLETVVLVDDQDLAARPEGGHTLIGWQAFLGLAGQQELPTVIDADMAAILYTSGSTGKPKGVVLSHRNLVAGAVSVSDYLAIGAADRLLAVLPFSFDYGLNQLTTCLLTGACCVLLDYLLPKDVINALPRHQITGLAAVPPLWAQLAGLDWPPGTASHLRYLTNSGGKMPKAVLAALRQKAPNSQFFLMYGLTEAFRSTYLPPAELDRRPDSMGKAIPNAEVLVVREDGSACAPHEPGELVHRGALVAMGYWNDPARTAERFRPAPGQLPGLPLAEIAVWSGDTVSMDEEGYLYFVGRRDDMIKTSGYRVSPTEIEEVVYASGLVKEAAAIGIDHDTLGQAVVVVASPQDGADVDRQALLEACRLKLANFMVPAHIAVLPTLPKNPNGKIDRKALAAQFADCLSTPP